MIDLAAIKAREKAAHIFASEAVAFGAEDWLCAGYGGGPRAAKKDLIALIAEVEMLREESSSYLAILESELNFKVIKSPDK